MGFEIYFPEDIRNALLAADAASTLTAVEAAWGPGVDPVALRAWRRGYKAALTTVALAFGMKPARRRSARTTADLGLGDDGGSPG